MFKRTKEFLRNFVDKIKNYLQITADEVIDISVRGAVLLLLVTSLPKILHMISIYRWGEMGMLSIYALVFFLCYIVAWRKDIEIIKKSLNIIVKMNPRKKIEVHP